MRALWIGVVVLSSLCGIATGFLAALAGEWSGLLLIAAWPALVVATVKLRPEDGFRWRRF
jgi:hypothetical protein